MDEFAQTRGSDDLFDDDFTPITEAPEETVVDAPMQPAGRRKSQSQTEGAKPPAVRGDRSGTGGIRKVR